MQNNLKTYSEIYYNIAIGTGAVITAIVGGKFIWQYIERSIKRKYYIWRYPIAKFGSDFRIIESTIAPGAIYLFDTIEHKKHHIWNMKTVYDLGWHVIKRETLTDVRFNQINTGKEIRTWGELGE